MTKRYSLAEARSKLVTIVSQAEAGQAVELTRYGKPVAVVISPREVERLRRKRMPFREAYRRFLAACSLQEIGIDDGWFEAGRERTPGRKVTSK